MSKNTYNNSSVLRATTTLLLAFGLVFSLGITPNVSAQTQSKPAKSTAKQPETSPARGQQEGIKVHGHWTIEVRNPDGALVTHREFENALTVPGASSLALFLSRSNTPGLWNIHLQLSGAIFPLDIFEPAETAEGTNVFKNLTVTAPVVSVPLALTLSGSATASTECSIVGVSTSVQRGGGTYSQFTAATLATFVNVAPGQFIQVTVRISFS